MKDLVIGIIGGGVVGRAVARSYVEHVKEVRVYDTIRERRTHPIGETVLSDIVFVCLPTPQKRDSLELDTEYVRSFFQFVAPHSETKSRNYVLRSTVPIGTTRRLAEQYGLRNLVHSPEFLTARCSVTDAHIPSRNVIGTPTFGECKKSWYSLQDLYSARFPGIPCHLMSSDESEAVKLFQNGFFATKVSYWNECRQLADKLDLDWDRVMEAILADGRISHSHTKVPGPDGLGFAGSCLPKDLAQLAYDIATECRPIMSVTAAAHYRNIQDRERGGHRQRT